MKKNKIIVAVCSRNFNKNLLNLMDNIYLNSMSSKFDLEVLIIFNNSKKIMQNEFLLLAKKLKKINLNVIYEKKIGISHVRNKCLSYLKNTKFDYYCFIDDDCLIKKDYLINHLNFIKKNRCNIITGPQIYNSKIIFFRTFERKYRQGASVSWASTNNVFFTNKIFKKNIHFSINVTKYGFGEDQLFFTKLSKSGEIIKWNNNPVFETIQINREKLIWFLSRNFRYGLTGFLIERELHGSLLAFFINLIKAMVYFIKMILNLISLLTNTKKNFYSSLSNLSRCLGRVCGSINVIK